MIYFVRTAGEQDIDAIRRLLAESWHAAYDGFYGAETVETLTARRHSVEAIRRSILRKDGEFLVADNGKDIGGIGFAAMSDVMAKTAILHQLYVRPHCQNQGIGRDIFAELETCFPDAEIMRLEVEPRNLRAISFYSRLGFLDVDRIGPDAEGIEALVMEKTLAL